MADINFAVIGAGYWGKNLVRVYFSAPGAKLKCVCDLDEKKLNFVRSFYPSVKTTVKIEDVFSDPEINAVVIAAPTSAHYPLAKAALSSGKHVLVEKPMTKTSSEAEEVVRLAREKNLVLMVDHTFVFTGAVRKIKELVSSGELGELRYFDSERVNLGLIQKDVNVLYDLAVHDLSILQFTVSEKPKFLAAHGDSYVTRGGANEVEEIAHLHLEYPSGFSAHIHSSWLSPVKLRKTIIGGSKKMALYDDIEPSEKIKIYDHGVDIDFESETPDIPIYRSGDVLVPKIDASEALSAEAKEFIAAIRESRAPITSGEDGLALVRILEAATESMKNGGIKMAL
jgi:predicted dehydrogenase